MYGAMKLTVLKPLVQENESIVLSHECFDAVSFPATEQEQRRSIRIHIEVFVDQSDKTVDGFAHVGISTCYVYLIDNSDVT